MAKPFPDALPALFRQLRDLGLSLGIITDGDPDVVDNLLPRVPCLELFDTIVCSWEVGATKPNERIFARALESSGCTGRTSAFVGDAPADVQGARSSGMLAVIVDRSNSYPRKPKPDIIVRSLVELPPFLSG
jgi:putative hydrolase of the HAD superfamily